MGPTWTPIGPQVDPKWIPSSRRLHLRELILMVGLPYSGKSIIARKLGHPIVCPDAIRVALHGERYIVQAEGFVWAIAKTMVAALFAAGHDTVIVDATNNTRKRRIEWVLLAAMMFSVEVEVKAWILSTDPDECLHRARSYGDEDIVPTIKRMADEFEAVSADEGLVLVFVDP